MITARGPRATLSVDLGRPREHACLLGVRTHLVSSLARTDTQRSRNFLGRDEGDGYALGV